MDKLTRQTDTERQINQETDKNDSLTDKQTTDIQTDVQAMDQTISVPNFFPSGRTVIHTSEPLTWTNTHT